MRTPHSNAVMLVVFMEPGEDEEFKRIGFFCCRREPFADGMSEFSRKTGKLPYSDKFVAITVLRFDEEICESTASIYGERHAGDKPVYAVLKNSRRLLADIEIVGDDDVRQIFTQIARRWKIREPYGSLLNRIDNLAKLTPEEKCRKMRERTFDRGHHEYTEARLNRCLELAEVKSWGVCE